jgi:N-acyl-D-aspartate/D-glutamate deacylase
MTAPVVLAGGEVHDGTGRAPVHTDIMIDGGSIASVGAGELPAEATVIDVSGLVVSPGFIDVHSHSDYTLFVDPRAVSSIAQGVTLEIVGNCGHGCAPLLNRALGPLAVYGPIGACGHPPDRMGSYLDRMEMERPAVNIMSLTPNGQLRLKAVGLEARAASPAEAQIMADDLVEAMAEGAAGFSTGLEYTQEFGATEEEVAALARVAGRAGGLYATHTRDRDEGAVEAVEEAIRTAERAGIQLQISHITPRSGPEAIRRCLDTALEARARGNPVHFDMHTRLFGFTHLKNIVPATALGGSLPEISARLRDPSRLESYRAHRNLIARCGWEKVVVARSVTRPEWVGMSFAEIGAVTARDPLVAALDLLADEASDPTRAMVILRTYTEEQLRMTYEADDCMIGSDATALANDGPLADEIFYGAYTWASWFWRRMVRETRTFSRAEAIRRMTGLPATVFGLAGRGRIAPDFRADIAVFDPEGFSDRGTVAEPNLTAVGMRHVFVNGVHTLKDGIPTGERGGEVIRRRHL